MSVSLSGKSTGIGSSISVAVPALAILLGAASAAADESPAAQHMRSAHYHDHHARVIAPGVHDYVQPRPGIYNYAPEGLGTYDYAQPRPGVYNYAPEGPGAYDYAQPMPNIYNYAPEGPGAYGYDPAASAVYLYAPGGPDMFGYAPCFGLNCGLPGGHPRSDYFKNGNGDHGNDGGNGG